jgi:hypothetical protein
VGDRPRPRIPGERPVGWVRVPLIPVEVVPCKAGGDSPPRSRGLPAAGPVAVVRRRAAAAVAGRHGGDRAVVRGAEQARCPTTRPGPPSWIAPPTTPPRWYWLANPRRTLAEPTMTYANDLTPATSVPSAPSPVGYPSASETLTVVTARSCQRSKVASSVYASMRAFSSVLGVSCRRVSTRRKEARASVSRPPTAPSR